MKAVNIVAGFAVGILVGVLGAGCSTTPTGEGSITVDTPVVVGTAARAQLTIKNGRDSDIHLVAPDGYRETIEAGGSFEFVAYEAQITSPSAWDTHHDLGHLWARPADGSGRWTARKNEHVLWTEVPGDQHEIRVDVGGPALWKISISIDREGEAYDADVEGEVTITENSLELVTLTTP